MAASHFIEKVDFNTIITTGTLDYLSGNDDEIVLEMADEAVEEMKSYLVDRYNITSAFDMTGSERNKTLLMYGKDIALYHLFSRRHTNQIPTIRAKRYEAAMEWLRKVQKQEINPVGLPISGIKMVASGGNTKRENHQ